MIGQLRGVVVESDADGTVILDVGGVGYEIMTPLGTLGRARGAAQKTEEGAQAERITLFVHTHVREDVLFLFGFASAADKAVFRTLISVSSIGPKTALSILSAMPADELARVVARKDTQRLTTVPGIGKKTAERLVLELADKLAAVVPASPAGGGAAADRPGVPPSAPASVELLAGALTRMGFRPHEAERAIAQLGPRVESEPLQVLIREALSLLSR